MPNSVVRRLADPMTGSFAISLVVFAISRDFLPTALVASIVTGGYAFIVAPGYLVVKLLRQKVAGLDVLGFSLIFGIALQMLLMAFNFVLNGVVVINFYHALIGETLISFIILETLVSRSQVSQSPLGVRALLLAIARNKVTYVFIISLAVRLVYSYSNVMSIAPDGALYENIARTAVTTGKFGASVFNDQLSPSNPFLVSDGLIPHIFVAFGLSLFYAISSVSLTASLSLVVLGGSLLVYPIYSLTRSFFGENAGLLASLLVSVNPLFLFFSSILYGPEIIGVLFLLCSILVLVETKASVTGLAFAGLLYGASEESWWPYFYIALPTVVITIMMIGIQNHKIGGTWRTVLVFGLPTASFAFGLKIASLYFIFLPIVLLEVSILACAIYLKKRPLVAALSFPAGLMLVTLPFLIRLYITPLQVGTTVEHALTHGIVSSIVNAFTALLPKVSLQGPVDYLKYLNYEATSALLVLFVMSFILRASPWAKVILGALSVSHFALVSFVPPPSYPQYLYSFSRFLLLPVSVAIIGASGLISRVYLRRPNEASHAEEGWKSRNSLLRKTGPRLLLALIVLGSFVPLYQPGLNAVAAQNPIKQFGWSGNMFTWIDTHANSSDLIVSARPRELSLFTYRGTVEIIYPMLSQKQIDFPQLCSIVRRFGASYVQVDRYFSDALPRLSYLYFSIGLPLGSTIMPGPQSNSSSGATLCIQSYELVFRDVGSGASVGIWRVLPTSETQSTNQSSSS